MIKKYDAVDIIDTAEHDGAIYNMKANVFKYLAISMGKGNDE